MSRQIRTIALAVCVAAALSATTQANVNAGFDYFHTLSGTRLDLGGELGVVEFMGNPINPANLHNVDTIVERKEDAELPDAGSTDTIPIEMIALSLKSVEPVQVSGFEPFFDIFIILDLGSDILPGTGDETPSLGVMTIEHELEWPDDEMNTPEGTFDSSLRLYLDALFVPVGQTEPAFVQDIDDLLLRSEATPWTHSHDAVPPLPGTSNFFLGALVQHPLGEVVGAREGAGMHKAENVIPEPATIILLGLGAAALVRRRKA